MKSIAFAFIVLFIAGLSDKVPGVTEVNPKLIKRMTKRITRIWPDRTIYIDHCDYRTGDHCLLNGMTFVILAEPENTEHSYDTLGYIYQNRVYSCRQGGCNGPGAPGNSDNGFVSEFFDYYAILDTGAGILKIDIYNYQATHGQEICSSGWLKQFVGFSGSEELVYGKNVQAVSGATISANAITSDINEKISCLKNSLNM